LSGGRIIEAPAALARRKQSLAGCFAARLDVDRDLVQTAMQSTFRTDPAIGGAALTAIPKRTPRIGPSVIWCPAGRLDEGLPSPMPPR
jgi:hypothetical protein